MQAQRYNSMRANRFSYIHIGGGAPYVSLKGGFEFQPSTFVELQGHTDGGGIWRGNTYNDWRSLSLLRALRIPSMGSEIRLGCGIVQSEERILNQKSNTFGAAPQIALIKQFGENWALGGSATWPFSPAQYLTPAITLGLEYRIGRYVKENGLY